MAAKKRVAPYKFTEKLGKRIVAAIRAGNYVSVAARLAGVHRDTVYDWLAVGEAASAESTHPAHHAFALAYRSAEAEAEASIVEQITGGTQDPQLLKVWLEFLRTRFPKRWMPGYAKSRAEIALIRANLEKLKRGDDASGEIQLVVRCADGPKREGS
jgi:transposase-like protein